MMESLNRGLIRVLSNNQLAAAEVPAVFPRPEDMADSLTRHIRNAWDLAKRQKIEIETRMLRSLRAVNGEYEPAKLAQIRQMGGSEIYMTLTTQKVRDAKAWIVDILLPPGDKPWSADPTPEPELSPEITEKIRADALNTVFQSAMMFAQMTGQMVRPEEFNTVAGEYMEALSEQTREMLKDAAEKASIRMTRRIEDQLVEGRWESTFRDTVSDVVTYPAGFMKSPVLRRKMVQKWKQNPDGRWMPDVGEAIVIEFDRPSPFDIYPVGLGARVDDVDIIERHRLSRQTLNRLLGVPGYKDDSIRWVLNEYGRGGLREWLWTDADRTRLETGSSFIYSSEFGTIDALEYWGSVQGRDLLEWGIPGSQVPDPSLDYNVNAWLIGNKVIKAVINPNKLGKKPYYKASFQEIPGSFWGKGTPELIADVQDVCNATARAMVNNLGIACLTGDTVVYRHEKAGAKKYRKYNPRHTVEVTLNQLWESKHDHNSGLRRNVLRSLDEATGEFYGNRVVDIFDNGVRPVYRVKTVAGYNIKATMNHRFMREDGEYQMLEGFANGDLIAVNGNVVPLNKHCVDCEKPIVKPTAIRCKSCAAKINKWNVTQAELAIVNRNVNPNTARGRKLVRGQMKATCEKCSTPERLHIHHIDKDPLNCRPENLMTLCEPCHAKCHARHDNYGDPFKHIYVDYDMIVSIEYVGEERVFDLQMEAPNHNFVANGFVSHNSGPQVEVNVDRVEPGVNVEEIYPWKVWRSNDLQMTGAPAVKFYQPGMMAESLLAVYTKFSMEADDKSGVPAYAHGNAQVGGAGNTAAGLSMLMTAAARGIKSVISSIDNEIISPQIAGMYEFNMMYSADESIKGDIKVRARGTSALMSKEQLAVRVNEMLQATNNDYDAQILGLEGRTHLIQELAKALGMQTDKVVPRREPTMPGNTAGVTNNVQSSANLDAAGNKVNGQDTAVFVNKEKPGA